MFDFFYETKHLLYTIPFLFGLALSLLSAFSLFNLDASIDHEGDWHLHVEKDIPSPNSFGEAMNGFFDLIGMGVIPFMIWLNLFSLSFGILGIILVSFTGFIWLLSPICLIVALILTGRLAKLLKPLAKDYGTPESSYGLLGKIATAVSAEITKDFGLIQYRDEKGNAFKLDAVNGGEDPIKQGDQVIISDVKASKEIFIVHLFKE